MKIAPTQLINPGIYENTDKRRDQQLRLKDAVNRSKSLSKDEKKEWTKMGYLLSTPQLKEMETLLIQEELHRLELRHKLEKIKNKND